MPRTKKNTKKNAKCSNRTKNTNNPTTKDTTTKDMTTFDDLPFEVQEMVGPYLRPHDLSRCVRVCKSWQTVFNPYLWKHVSEPPPQGPIAGYDDWHEIFLDCALDGALEKNAHLIQSLRLSHDDNTYFRDLLEYCPLAASFSLLTDLEIQGATGEDDWISGFIRLSDAGLKRLVIRLDHPDYDDAYGMHFGMESADAILELHTDTLEVLRIESSTNFMSHQVQILLSEAVNLRELFLLPSYRLVLEENCILVAEDIVEMGPWVCENLEVFGCQIGDIPRPDITRDIHGSAAAQSGFVREGTAQESIELQLKVYEQLSKMKRLRQLTLGVPYDTSHYGYSAQDKEYFRRYDCLAFTLESGLDLLKDLKELRVVQLEDMEVYIDGEAEQAWIAEHWPNVKIGVADYETDRDFETESNEDEYEDDYADHYEDVYEDHYWEDSYEYDSDEEEY
ncbi:hypothetical protein BGX23_011851 [Mortierella sp. AD031]|nr:hypothetical protein BGX23_011851 [Mortierella sp. AD031]